MRIPVLSGRDFRDGDAEAATRVAVVNQAFVDRFLPGRDAIGLKFGFWGGDAQIIGVVKTGKYQALNEPPYPHVYALAETVGVAIGVLACWPPARRAARTDPMEALRAE